MKPLMNHLYSKKGQGKTMPASLWMRYRAVEQRIRAQRKQWDEGVGYQEREVFEAFCGCPCRSAR